MSIVKNFDIKTWLRLATVVVVIGLLLFLPANTVDYWQAWFYLTFVFSASILMTIYLMRKDPALLKRRSSDGPLAEKRVPQKIAMLIVSVGFIGTMIVPAVDHRFGWSHVALYATVAGDVLLALGYYVVFLVTKQNTFASAKVELAQDQRVISTGPYALVRHPMYSGLALSFFGTPLALGSYWGLLASVVMAIGLIWRLYDEEKFLVEKLQGYAEYRRQVRWRSIPGIF